MVITLNGDRYTCPDKHTITLGQYQKIYELWGEELGKDPIERDYFRLFCILVGKSFSAYAPSKENDAIIWYCIKWVFESFDSQDFIIYGGTKYKAEKAGNLSIGQVIAIRQELEKHKFIQESISYALAVWLQPLIDGHPNMDKVKELELRLLDMKACEAFPVGFFLLKQSQTFGLSSSKLWSLANISRMMVKRLFPNWRGYIGLQGTQTFP